MVVAAYVSRDLIDKPQQCAALGILIHYFLVAHFCWIFVQVCVNLSDIFFEAVIDHEWLLSLSLSHFQRVSPRRFDVIALFY